MNKDSKLPKENLRPKIKHDIKQEYSDDSDNDSSVSLVTDGSCQSSSSKELCPICLCSFKNQQLAKSDVCEHKFCLECLQEWSKKTNTCPIDRKVFKSIRSLDGTIVIKTEDKQQQNFFEEIDDVTYCQICNRCDREDILLLCDGCDQGYHIECLTPPLSHIPIGNWFCVGCTLNRQRESRRQLRELSRAEQTTSRLRQSLTLVRPFVRTRFSERVRSTVNQGRIERGAYIVVSESETDEDFDTDQDDDSDTDQDDEDVDEEFIDEEYVDESPELPKNTSIDDSITSAIERCLNTPIVPIQRSSTIKLKRTITFKRRKRRSTKKVRRRRRTTTKITIAEDGSKVKTKVIRRKKQRRKRYRRVKRSIPSVQERIINSIQKTQLVAKISRDTVPITLNSIELERLTENKKDKIRGTCFPKRAQPWFQTSILNEIDETDPSIPLNSMSILRSEEPRQSNSTSQTQFNLNQTNSSTCSNFFDNILSSQQIILAPCSQIQVKRDGSVGLVSSRSNTSTKSSISTGSTKSIKTNRSRMEDSNVLLTNAPYDPFNPDDDEEMDKVEIKQSNNNKVETKSEILDSAENKITSKDTVAILNELKSSENAENKAKDVSLVKEEKEVAKVKKESTPIKKSNNISKEDNKYRDISKSPNSNSKRRLSRTRSRSRSRSSKRSQLNESKKISTKNNKSIKDTVKKEKSRSRSSSRSRGGHKHSNGSKRSSSSHNSSHHKSPRHHGNRSFKKSRSRSRSSDSLDKHRQKHDSSSRKDSDLHTKNEIRTHSAHKPSQQKQQHFHERSNQLIVEKKYSKESESNSEINIKKENSINSNINKSKRSPPKYSELIEEMIKEETQQTIDVNAIKLPTTRETINKSKPKIKNEPIDLKSLEPNSTNRASNSKIESSLDKRLNQMLDSNETIKVEIHREKKQQSINSSDPIKSSSSEEPKVNNINGSGVKEEPYDLEIEYQNTVSKSVVEQNIELSKNVKQEKSTNESELLNTQEKIVNTAKIAIKPYYMSKKISKEGYKIIMKKVVTKALEQNKTGSIIDSNKVNKMVSGYAKKLK